MGGGSTPAQQVQQTKSSNEPPAYIQPYLQSGIQDLTNLYNSRKAPEYYQGDTVAEQSPETKAALEAMYRRGANGSPLVAGSQGMALDTATGKYLDLESNPYYQSAVNATLRPVTENFTDKVLPAVTAQFGAAGRAGSGLHEAAVDRATTAFNRDALDATSKMGLSAYTTERANQIAAAGMAPNLAGADYTDINAMGTAGQGKDTYSQQQIDADIARYNYDQNKDWNYITRYLAALNAGYPGGETSGTVYGSATPSQNPGASAFGGAMSVAGLGLSAAAMFM